MPGSNCAESGKCLDPRMLPSQRAIQRSGIDRQSPETFFITQATTESIGTAIPVSNHRRAIQSAVHIRRETCRLRIFCWANSTQK